jgi:hypothetical protein
MNTLDDYFEIISDDLCSRHRIHSLEKIDIYSFHLDIDLETPRSYRSIERYIVIITLGIKSTENKYMNNEFRLWNSSYRGIP